MKEKANEFYGRNHIKYDLTSSTDIFKLADDYAQSRIDNTGCQCSEPIGYTTIKCCNHCGKSIESFWNKSEHPNIFENNNPLDKPDNKVEPCKHKFEFSWKGIGRDHRELECIYCKLSYADSHPKTNF